MKTAVFKTIFEPIGSKIGMDLIEELNLLEIAPALYIDLQFCIDHCVVDLGVKWNRTGTCYKVINEQIYLHFYNGHVLKCRVQSDSYGRTIILRDNWLYIVGSMLSNSDNIWFYDDSCVNSIEYKKHPLIGSIGYDYINLKPGIIRHKDVKYLLPDKITYDENYVTSVECGVRLMRSIRNIYWENSRTDYSVRSSGLFEVTKKDIEDLEDYYSDDYIKEEIKFECAEMPQVMVESCIDTSELDQFIKDGAPFAPDIPDPLRDPKFLFDYDIIEY